MAERSMVSQALHDIGTTVDASIRQGAKELAQVLPAFPDSIRPVEEPGTPGNPLAREIYESKHEKGAELKFPDFPSEAKAPEKETPEPER